MNLKTIIYVGPSFFLSYLIPKDKKLLLFQTMRGNGLRDNPKYLYLYAKRYLPQYKLKFFKSLDEPKEYIYKGVKKHDFSLKNWWSIIRAKHIFVDANFFSDINLSCLIGRFSIIMCWHGTVQKLIGVDEKNYKKKNPLIRWFTELLYSKYKLVLTTCEYSSKMFKRTFKNNVEITGYPRNDIFCDTKTFSIEDYNKKLNLEKFDKVFLYAPTWKDYDYENPFSEKGLKELNEIFKKKNQILLVKCHVADTKLLNIECSNIMNITSEVHDINELFPFVDVLITDYSGCIFDYSLLEKPILFYCYDYEKYNEIRGLYLNTKQKFKSVFY